jgi:acetyl-CoA acetyltransferase family protein
MSSAFIYDAVRTPFGRYGKALSGARPDDMGAEIIKALLKRNPDLDPALVDDVIMGNANQAGEDNRNLGRMASLLAGLPVTVPGVTVNRLCASSIESVVQAARAIETGDAAIVIAGGVESMTRSPWVLMKPERPFPGGEAKLVSSGLGWHLTNPLMPPEWTVSLGETAEQVAELAGIGREEQDAFALRSHQLSMQAWEAGRYSDEIIQVPGFEMPRDESIRPDTSAASLAALRPAFRKEGTVTAGNSSPLNDGASGVLIAAEGALPGDPLARVVSRGVAGCAPNLMGTGPVPAVDQALQRAGLTWDDVDLVELNEAFAAQCLACLKQWPDLDPAKVNIDGGALAIGHPLGASGTRLIGHLARMLARRGGGVGVAAACIGVGQGLAVVLEA